MTWRTISLAIALGIGTTACDKLPFIGSKDTADSTTTPAAVDSTPQPTAPAAAVAPPPAPTPAPRQVRPVQRFDEAWTPVDTGTVAPGMSREQVIAVWGVPVAERVTGTRGYLYFRNGCEVTCGTFDVVFLENGAVVDVIARGPGHTYAGTSSSPAGRQPAATRPGAGAPMTVPADSASEPVNR